jgi:formamidopyrimidine-DNA glycosylase
MLGRMPELPEVEHARQVFLRALGDRTLVGAGSSDPIVVAQGSESFSRALVGARLIGSDRRGKSVILRLASGAGGDVGLFFHLGLTGHVVVRPRGSTEELRFSRWWVETEETRVTLVDARRLARAIAGPYEEVLRSSGIPKLGPDALTVRDGASLSARYRGKSGKLPIAPIKLALMDQAKVAGLGNIHAAEALFHAHLHPDTPTSSLKSKDWDALAKGIETTLGTTLARLDPSQELVYVSDGGPNPFHVYRKDSTPCGVCGKTIEKMEHGGRSTYFCGKCQKPRR